MHLRRKLVEKGVLDRGTQTNVPNEMRKQPHQLPIEDLHDFLKKDAGVPIRKHSLEVYFHARFPGGPRQTQDILLNDTFIDKLAGVIGRARSQMGAITVGGFMEKHSVPDNVFGAAVKALREKGVDITKRNIIGIEGTKWKGGTGYVISPDLERRILVEANRIRAEELSRLPAHLEELRRPVLKYEALFREKNLDELKRIKKGIAEYDKIRERHWNDAMAFLKKRKPEELAAIMKRSSRTPKSVPEGVGGVDGFREWLNENYAGHGLSLDAAGAAVDILWMLERAGGKWGKPKRSLTTEERKEPKTSLNIGKPDALSEAGRPSALLEQPMWERIGKVPTLEEAIGLVLARRTRRGRGVRTQSVELEAKQSEANRKVLEGFFKDLEEREKVLLDKMRRGKPVIERNLVKLRNQREILNAMMKFGDRKLHATELAAAFILNKGLDKDALRSHFNACSALQAKADPPFSGNFTYYYTVLKGNLLKELHDFLYEKGEGYYATGIDLMKKFNTTRYSLNKATALLDLAGAVHKLPQDLTSKSYVWTHAKNNLPNPWWNAEYNILTTLLDSKAPLGAIEFIRPSRSMSGPTSILKLRVRMVKAPILQGHVLRHLEHLKKAGLVEITDYQEGRPLYTLSREGKEWVGYTMRNKILHPELHIRLLGAYEPSRLPVAMHRMYNIIRELRFRVEYDKVIASGKTPNITRIANTVELPMKTGWAIINRGSTTLRRFKPPKINEIAAHLEAIDLGEGADFLRNFKIPEGRRHPK